MAIGGKTSGRLTSVSSKRRPNQRGRLRASASGRPMHSNNKPDRAITFRLMPSGASPQVFMPGLYMPKERSTSSARSERRNSRKPRTPGLFSCPLTVPTTMRIGV